MANCWRSTLSMDAPVRASLPMTPFDHQGGSLSGSGTLCKAERLRSDLLPRPHGPTQRSEIQAYNIFAWQVMSPSPDQERTMHHMTEIIASHLDVREARMMR
jgi:hypothetical protein